MPKSNEIMSLHVGEAGCNLGTSCWELSCFENNVELDGTFSDKTLVPSALFMDVEGKKLVPRTVFVDLEPSTVDDIRVGKFRQLFRPNNLLNGKEDAANCFGGGFITLGKELVEPVTDCVRTLAERSDNMNYFMIRRGSGGGTGSGLTSCLMEELWVDFPKTNIYDFCVSLSSGISGPVEPYNAAFALHHSLRYSTLSLLFDNYTCYNLYDKFLDVCNVEFSNINQLLAHINSMVIQSPSDGDSLSVNLVPFPRLQFPVVSFAPLIPKHQTSYNQVDVNSIVKSCFENSNQLVNCDMNSGTNLAFVLMFRGDVNHACVNSVFQSLLAKKSIRFVQWPMCRYTYKVLVNSKPVKVLPKGDFAPTPRSCALLSNGTQIKQVFSKMCKKFDKLFSKRAFVHWYIAEEMEEGDFQDTKLDLDCLISNYSNIETDI